MAPFLFRFIAILVVFSLTLAEPLKVYAETGDNNCRAILEGGLAQAYQEARNQGRVLKHIPYLVQSKALNTFLQRFPEAAEPAAVNKAAEVKFWALVKEMILKPGARELTVDEAQLIASDPHYRATFEMVTVLGSVSYVHFSLVSTLMSYWQGQVKPAQFQYEKGFLKKSVSFLRSLYNGPLRFVTSMALPRARGSIEGIFTKQWKSRSGEYEPTAEEWLKLEEFKAKESFLQKRQFMKEHLTWTKFRRLVGTTALGLYIASQAMLVNYGLHNAFDSQAMTTQQFLEESENRLEANQIRLYNESVPFPHMAMEVDGTVYSYGQTHMTATPVAQYLQAQEIRELFAEDNNDQPVGLWNKVTAGPGKITGKLFKHLGPRSVQMTTLNLSPEGFARVQRFLETSRGMQYRNRTLAMDCATMVKYAIQDSLVAQIPMIGATEIPLPAMVDASPGMMNQYLALLKTMELKTKSGKSLVSDFEQVTSGTNADPHKILLRNLFVNNVENNLIVSMLNFSIPQRIYLHLRYGQQDFQFWNPEVVEIMQQAGDDAVTELLEEKASNQLEVFRSALKELSPLERTSEVKARWQRLQEHIELFLNTQISENEEIISASNSDFIGLIQAGFRLSYLQELQKEMRAGRTGENIQLPAGTLEKVLDEVRDLDRVVAPNLPTF